MRFNQPSGWNNQNDWTIEDRHGGNWNEWDQSDERWYNHVDALNNGKGKGKA